MPSDCHPNLFGLPCASYVLGSGSGLLLCHSVACSYSCAACSNTFPRHGAAANCRPMGSPSFVNPHGTEIAGIPHTLKGRVLRSMINSCRRRSSGCSRSSAIAGGGIGTVGVSNTSTWSNTFLIASRLACRSRLARRAADAVVFAPDRIRASVAG
jgi:hypothetical protein